jgi:hypothetical protein
MESFISRFEVWKKVSAMDGLRGQYRGCSGICYLSIMPFGGVRGDFTKKIKISKKSAAKKSAREKSSPKKLAPKKLAPEKSAPEKLAFKKLSAKKVRREFRFAKRIHREKIFGRANFFLSAPITMWRELLRLGASICHTSPRGISVKMIPVCGARSFNSPPPSTGIPSQPVRPRI